MALVLDMQGGLSIIDDFAVSAASASVAFPAAAGGFMVGVVTTLVVTLVIPHVLCCRKIQLEDVTEEPPQEDKHDTFKCRCKVSDRDFHPVHPPIYICKTILHNVAKGTTMTTVPAFHRIMDCGALKRQGELKPTYSFRVCGHCCCKCKTT